MAKQEAAGGEYVQKILRYSRLHGIQMFIIRYFCRYHKPVVVRTLKRTVTEIGLNAKPNLL